MIALHTWQADLQPQPPRAGGCVAKRPRWLLQLQLPGHLDSSICAGMHLWQRALHSMALFQYCRPAGDALLSGTAHASAAPR